MTLFQRPLLYLLFPLLLAGCFSSAPSQRKNPALFVDTASKIDVLTYRDQFTSTLLPTGWTLQGVERKSFMSPDKQIRHISSVRSNHHYGLQLQSAERDFILARYTNASLLVTPYLNWFWNVSEHKGPHHPVKILVGFYGGAPSTPSPVWNEFIWRKDTGLPRYDRLLAIGFDDMALKRANLYTMGNLKYYVQRGGIEQTNQWFFEATDLSLIYRQAWPQDDTKKTYITFVGFSVQADPNGGGATFSNVSLSR